VRLILSGEWNAHDKKKTPSWASKVKDRFHTHIQEKMIPFSSPPYPFKDASTSFRDYLLASMFRNRKGEKNLLSRA
jgi:hypothetical protein